MSCYAATNANMQIPGHPVEPPQLILHSNGAIRYWVKGHKNLYENIMNCCFLANLNMNSDYLFVNLSILYIMNCCFLANLNMNSDYLFVNLSILFINVNRI